MKDISYERVIYMQVMKTKLEWTQCLLLRLCLECEKWDTAPTFKRDMNVCDLETDYRSCNASLGRLVGFGLMKQVPKWARRMSEEGRRTSGAVN